MNDDMEYMQRMQLRQLTGLIGRLDEKAMEKAWSRWDSIGKPLRSLGLLEKAVVKVAGMTRTADVHFDKKAIVVMCGDHGVVAEGVTQTDSSVTRIVAKNLSRGCASVNIMATKAGADIFPVDMGMYADAVVDEAAADEAVVDKAAVDEASKGEAAVDEAAKGEAAVDEADTDPFLELGDGDSELKSGRLIARAVAQGTGNIVNEPAMSQADCIRAILRGIEIVGELVGDGYDMIGMGEMGIGNTTPSTAIVSVLLNLPANVVTGRGAGLSDEGLAKKIHAVCKAVDRYWTLTEESYIKPGEYFQMDTAIELMAQLGGYEIAGMTGLCLGGAIYGVPIVLDGYISTTAALCAKLICPGCVNWLLASHISAEPASERVMKALGLEPVICAGLCLGEGTGAAAAMPIYDMGLAVYREMSTFEEISVERYKRW